MELASKSIQVKAHLRVLMVIQQYRPIVGGAERQAELLATTLAEHGCTIALITGQWTHDAPRFEINSGVEVCRIFTFWNFFGLPGLRKLGQLAYLVGLFFTILRRAGKFDVVHIHQALRPAVFAALASKLRGTAVIAKVGSSGKTSDLHSLRSSVFGPFLVRILFRSLDRIICTSEASVLEYQASGFPESRLVRIPNGVCFPVSKRATPSSTQPRAIYLGRLSWEKGVDVLIQAISILKGTRPDCPTVDIVGDGPERRRLEALTVELHVEDHVVFHGECSEPSVMLASASVFVLPSRSEGMSNALLEALAHGLPVVVTDVGGNSEASGFGKAGRVVEPENATALAEALDKILRGEELEWDRESRVSWVRQQFGIGEISTRYLELYEGLTSLPAS